MRRITGIAAMLLATGVFAQSDEPAIFVPHYYSLGANVVSFTVDVDTGVITQADSEPAGVWMSALTLSPDGSTIVTGNAAGSSDGSSSIDYAWVLHVNSDATLTVLRDNAIPNSPLDLQFITDTRVAILNTDFSNSRVIIYDVDPVSGTLTQTGSVGTGGFSASLAYSEQHDLLFAEDSNSDWIYAYRIDAGGSITQVDQISTAPQFALGLEVDPFGEHLYGNGGISGDVVMGFEIHDAVPFLTDIPGQPFASAGDSPFRITFVEDGSLALLGHGRDATIHSYFVDGATGALTATGWSFDVGLQGSVGGMGSIGDLFFVLDDSTAIDGISGVYVFRASSDGTLTQIGDVVPTGTPRPEGPIAVWNPGGDNACAPDITGDGNVDTNDYFAFLALYQAQDPRADFTGEGDINTNDFFAFLAAYQIGC